MQQKKNPQDRRESQQGQQKRPTPQQEKSGERERSEYRDEE